MKKLKKNKSLNIVMGIFKVIGVMILIIFILMIYLQRLSDNKLSLFNYRMFTVVSRSMEPKYTIGDVLISKKLEPSEVKVGDAISYEGKKGDTKDKTITHEVVKVVEDNGKYYFHAKGINNLIEDPVISEDQLYGIVIHKSTILSTIYRVVGTNVGFYLCIVIPLVFVITHEIVSTLLEKEDKRRKKEQ